MSCSAGAVLKRSANSFADISPPKKARREAGKEDLSNLTRTGHRLLFGYDGGIAITMPRALSIRLATAVGYWLVKTRLKMNCRLLVGSRNAHREALAFYTLLRCGGITVIFGLIHTQRGIRTLAS
jgi:hypothetical protein